MSPTKKRKGLLLANFRSNVALALVKKPRSWVLAAGHSKSGHCLEDLK